MEALFISTGVVALAEIGDKTQLLAFILAARFKKPVPIIWVFCVPPWSTTRWPVRWARGLPRSYRPMSCAGCWVCRSWAWRCGP